MHLESAGFEFRQGTYHYKQLINKYIFIEIEIDLEERWLAYYVKIKNLDEYYIPFYLEEYRINNSFYERTVYGFNQIMDSLCRKNILWRPGIINKPEPSRGKEHVGDNNHRGGRYIYLPFGSVLWKNKRHTQNKSRARSG